MPDKANLFKLLEVFFDYKSFLTYRIGISSTWEAMNLGIDQWAHGNIGRVSSIESVPESASFSGRAR